MNYVFEPTHRHAIGRHRLTVIIVFLGNTHSRLPIRFPFRYTLHSINPGVTHSVTHCIRLTQA